MFAITDFNALVPKEVKMHSQTGKCIHSATVRMVRSHFANRISHTIAVVKNKALFLKNNPKYFKQKLL